MGANKGSKKIKQGAAAAPQAPLSLPQLSRRDFLRKAALAAGGAVAAGMAAVPAAAERAGPEAYGVGPPHGIQPGSGSHIGIYQACINITLGLLNHRIGRRGSAAGGFVAFMR